MSNRALRGGTARTHRHHTAAVAFLAGLLLAGCTTSVSGYESPVPHDYGDIGWMPVVTEVRQPFITGAGRAAAVANDGSSTPAIFQDRLQQLPADAREGQLVSMQVGLRLVPERNEAWQTGARITMTYAPEFDMRFPEQDFYTWDATHRWLAPRTGTLATQSFLSPYPNLSGITVRISTMGGDLSSGEAVIGTSDAEVWSLPDGGEPVTMLAAGQTVHVTGSAEGWARVELPNSLSGFVALERFHTVPEPAHRPQRPLRLELRDDTDAVIRTAEVPASELRDNAHLTIEFDPVPDAQHRIFTFALSVSDEPGNPGVTLRVTGDDRYTDGTLLHVDADTATGADLVFRPVYASSPTLLDVPLDRLPRHGEWLTIADPPDLPAGLSVAVHVVPGEGVDADRLRVGVTSGRVPFGGWRAVAEDDARLSGALMIRTQYTRNIEMWPMVTASMRHLRDGARHDPAFALLYVAALTTLTAATFWLWRARPLTER